MPDHKSPILTATSHHPGRLNRVVINGIHLNSQTKWCIEHLCKVDLVQTGSSLKLCKPAGGSEDLRPKLAPTCEWNNSPAQAIMDRADSGVFELNRNRFAYGNQSKLNPSSVATANKDMQTKALAILGSYSV
ncbi:MAG: hypothetical protein NWS01_06610 [Burkholderiales bacterium]|nr:hypothetical protein [Burkholderiales bacterium]